MSEAHVTPKTNTLAIVSLICGILGFLTGFLGLFCCGFIALLSFPLSLTGVITGHMARRIVNPIDGSRQAALGGLIAGYVGILLCVLVILFVATFAMLGPKFSALMKAETDKLTKLSLQNSEMKDDKATLPPSITPTKPENNSEEKNPQNQLQEAMKAAVPNPGDFRDIVQAYLKPFTQDSPLELESLASSLGGADTNAAPAVTTKAWLEGQQIAIQEGDNTTLYDIDKVTPVQQARIVNSLISGNHISDANDLMKASRILSFYLLNRPTTDSVDRPE